MLVNVLLLGVDICVGDFFMVIGKGIYIIIIVWLFYFFGGGDLIDLFGICEFGLGYVLWDDVEVGFIEFCDLFGYCCFCDCKYDCELGCVLF